MALSESATTRLRSPLFSRDPDVITLEGARSRKDIYRPLSLGRPRNGIKSALGQRNVDAGEGDRECKRASFNIPATLRCVGLEGALAFITNISAGGPP
jgi:hypothetical protein